MSQGKHNRVKGERRVCAYCGQEFEPYQDNQAYCTPNHRKYAANDRRAVRAFEAALKGRLVLGRVQSQ